MKCPGRELLFDTHADPERTAFAAHAVHCPDCQALLALHRSTTALLERTEATPLDAAQKARVWSKLEKQRSATPAVDWRLPLAAAALLAGAAYIFTVVRPVAERAPPPLAGEWLDLSENTALTFSGAEIHVGGATKLLFETDELAREIRFFRGAATISETFASRRR